MIFFDVQTPGEFKSRVELYRSCPGLTPVYVDTWDTPTVRRSIDAHLSGDRPLLLTTRLDNDDSLHKDYIRELRGSIQDEQPGFFNFPNGLIYSRGRVFSHKDLSNPFASLLEPTKGYRTVWQMQHQRIQGSGQVRQLPLANAWLQVVHDTNVSNRVRGPLVKNLRWLEAFPHLTAEDVTRETPLSIVWDNYFGYPGRRLRERLIGTVKPLLGLLRARRSP